MKSGFSLIEMIVAVGVFLFVITISLTAFLNISDIQRKAEALRIINDNLNFSLETMMKEIRAGSGYGVGGSSLSITNIDGKQVIYRLNNERIERKVNGNPFIALTAPEVNITTLLFVVDGAGSSDGLQPRVTIVLTGTAGEKEKVKTKLYLQTTISQRKIDS